jgi:hypothetical protein
MTAAHGGALGRACRACQGAGQSRNAKCCITAPPRSSERGMNLRRVHDAEFTITTKVPLKLCHVGLRNHSSPTEISRLDILVHPEDVFWIVFGLDFAELCIVAAIRGRKALAILIR